MSNSIRQLHRWISMSFLLVVAAIFAMLAIGHHPAQWFYYVPLAPLFLLMITGAYMFFRPHVAEARR